jgi:hypothetical protein
MEHPVPRYSILASTFNQLIDQGHSIPIDETKSRIHDHSLFDLLRERYPGFDVSLYKPEELRTILSVFGSIESAKLGITHNGLGLCLAYCIEVMQSPDAYAGFEDRGI